MFLATTADGRTVASFGENQKGTAGRGREKNVTTNVTHRPLNGPF